MKTFFITKHAILTLSIISICVVFCYGDAGDADIDAAPMEEKEQAALYSAIQGFVGNWWNGSDLYPDPCGWTPIQGVSCDIFDGLWYVTALSIGPIHDNSLDCDTNVEFRPELFELKHLKSLSFFNCFMSPQTHPIRIPTTNNFWENLAGSLEVLEFRSNLGLAGEVPTSFGGLIKLQSLVLIENGLTGELPGNVGNLTNLKRLVLSGNWFSGRIPDSYGRLSELLIMDLSRNSLSGSLPLTFGSMTSLLKLDLSSNQLQGSLPIVMGYLKNLTLLDLRNNNFSGGLTKSLQEMNSLEEMALSNNPIGGNIHGLKWSNLQNLAVLDLSNMGLVGEIPESIVELKKLRFLGLSNNNFTGNLSPKIAALASVNALYLNGNNLTGELKFSEMFYGKLGRRFGAWDNPNLCYPVRLMSTGHAPYGVRPCQEEQQQKEQKEVNLQEPNSISKLDAGNSDENSNSLASLGSSSYLVGGFWWVFLVHLFMMDHFLDCYL